LTSDRKSPPHHTLSLPPEEMRALGYRVVDMIVAHWEGVREQAVVRTGSRRALEALFREAPPEGAADIRELLDRLEQEVFGQVANLIHPRFFAFVPSPSNYVSVLADMLAAGFNTIAGTWLAGSAAIEIELVTLDWLRRLCGLPETAGGLFVSGGSAANLTALAVARHVRLAGRGERGAVFFSDQTHSSVERGLRILGFDPACLHRIPSDDACRLPVAALHAAVAASRAAGETPCAVVANAGTVNTGAVDPLRELAAYCRGQSLWLHADGAYGAAAVLTPRGAALLIGLGEVDSLTLDPHKWLFQPFECGCLLLRDGALLRKTFRILPEYLRDVERAGEEVNPCDCGIQLTRGFRALKLWLSLKVFGLTAFRSAVEWGIHLAEVAEVALRASGAWEIVTPAQLGLVTFRYAPAGIDPSAAEQANDGLVEAMRADGYAMLSSTRLRGRTVLRLCPINPRATEAEVQETVRRLEELAEQLTPPGTRRASGG
jgi:aromatic-L-amino-acid/L-tryptophan decarboxylase